MGGSPPTQFTSPGWLPLNTLPLFMDLPQSLMSSSGEVVLGEREANLSQRGPAHSSAQAREGAPGVGVRDLARGAVDWTN